MTTEKEVYLQREAHARDEYSQSCAPDWKIGAPRYAVDRWRIREGHVCWTYAYGPAVNWGEGPNYQTSGYSTREEAERELAEKQARADATAELGRNKWGAGPDVRWVIRKNEPHPVRLERGNLVSTRGWGIIRHATDNWPRLYESEDAAKAAQERRRQKCSHTWRWLSHEERQCSLCGEIESVPDID